MRPRPSILALAVLLPSASAMAEVGAIRDAATHEQLSLTLRGALRDDPMKTLPVSNVEDPSVASRPADILSESDIISHRGLATLLPKRAILQMPATLADRSGLPPGARLVGWTEFLAANRAWIRTVEVSRAQAEGNERMSESSAELLRTSKELVVATYQNGPISVLPLKPEAAGTK